MTTSEATELLSNIKEEEVCVVIMVKDLDLVESMTRKIKQLGYPSYIRTTPLGNEIVVTKKFEETA